MCVRMCVCVVVVYTVKPEALQMNGNFDEFGKLGQTLTFQSKVTKQNKRTI